MTERHFCTYFDHRYLVTGLALYRSLTTTCPEFTLWVLALDAEAELALTQAGLPNLRVVSLSALEGFDSELRACRETRSQVEYYFTCTPCLPRYLLEHEPAMQAITYLDSDLFFFNDPEPLFTELAGSSVGIIPHRFSPRAARSHARFGHYNVGWLTFFRNDAGMACLNWWRRSCIEWCHDRPEPDRYADQKYLDRFGQLFAGVHVIAHPGANLAPWNVEGHSIELVSGDLHVDKEQLIFFHFQGLRRLAWQVYDSNLGSYGAYLTQVLRERVFHPYLRALQEAEILARSFQTTPNEGTGIRRRGSGLSKLRYTAGRGARAVKAALTGNLVRL